MVRRDCLGGRAATQRLNLSAGQKGSACDGRGAASSAEQALAASPTESGSPTRALGMREANKIARLVDRHTVVADHDVGAMLALGARTETGPFHQSLLARTHAIFHPGMVNALTT